MKRISSTTSRQHNMEMTALDNILKKQDEQLHAIQAAEKQFESTGDLDALLAFWESIWSNGGLLFNGAKWTFRLPDLYIKIKQYDDAERILKKIKNPQYQDRVRSYAQKINAAKEKRSRSHM